MGQRSTSKGRSTGRPRSTARAGAAYHHGDLREALLAAAEAVLLEHGIEGFTLRECARRAGVSHGAPAHHFGDARGLLSECTALSFERLDTLMSVYRQRSDPTPFAQFTATGLAYVDFALANRARFQLMFRSDRLDFGNARLGAAGKRVYNQLVEAVTAMRPIDERGAVPRERIVMAWSLAHGMATLMLDNRAFAELVGGAGGPQGCGGSASSSAGHAHRIMEELLRLAQPLFEERGGGSGAARR